MFNLFNQKALNRINSEEFYDNDQNACIFWFNNLNPIVVYGNKEHPSWKCVNLNALPYIQCEIQNINFYAREMMLVGKPEFIRAYYEEIVSTIVSTGISRGRLTHYIDRSYSFPLFPSLEEQYLEEMVYMVDDMRYIIMAGSHKEIIDFIDSYGEISFDSATDLINYLGGKNLYIEVAKYMRRKQDVNQ